MYEQYKKQVKHKQSCKFCREVIPFGEVASFWQFAEELKIVHKPNCIVLVAEKIISRENN